MAFVFIIIGFYFTRNLDERKKPKARMLLIAFLLPFSNMLLFLIASFLDSMFSLYFALAGLYYMAIILPLCFLVSIVIYLIKKNGFFIKTVSLTFLIGGLLICFSIILDMTINYIEVTLALNKYKSVIEGVEKYKFKKGVYPENIASYKIKEKKYSYYKYETRERGQNYILTVSKYKYFDIHPYRFCSNSKYEGCHTQKSYPIEYRQFGKWVEGINLD